MPLSILIPMVGLGIAGIALLLHVLGLTAPARLKDDDSAAQGWLREFPEDPPTRIVLSHDHRAALIETAKGRGVVWPMGADTTARYLDGAKISQTAKGLRIDLPDYTAPHINLTLDPDEARDWPALMEARS